VEEPSRDAVTVHGPETVLEAHPREGFIVYRWPYDYNVPGARDDYGAQTVQALPVGADTDSEDVYTRRSQTRPSETGTCGETS